MRVHVVVGHAVVELDRHGRADDGAVRPAPVADGVADLLVRPAADAGFLVLRDVGADRMEHGRGEHEPAGKAHALAGRAGDGVAVVAADDRVHQVGAALELRLRRGQPGMEQHGRRKGERAGTHGTPHREMHCSPLRCPADFQAGPPRLQQSAGVRATSVRMKAANDLGATSANSCRRPIPACPARPGRSSRPRPGRPPRTPGARPRIRAETLDRHRPLPYVLAAASPSSSGLGRRPLTAITGVRIP